jgi:hypothetical protein
MRTLTIAAAIVAALPSISAAQQDRGFTDSWFWGIKAGGLALADSGGRYRQTPMAGAEWLITRTHGALYVSAGEAFFSQHALIPRDPTGDSGVRAVTVKNLREVNAAMLGFPGEHLRFHPYVGVGFTMQQLAAADPQGPFSSQDQLTFADEVIQANKVVFSPLFLFGGQYRTKWRATSVFGQGSISPANRNLLIYGGQPWNFRYELGLRYNMGSSISRE